MKYEPSTHEVLVYARAGQVILETVARNGDEIVMAWDLSETDQIIEDLAKARTTATYQVNTIDQRKNSDG